MCFHVRECGFVQIFLLMCLNVFDCAPNNLPKNPSSTDFVAKCGVDPKLKEGNWAAKGRPFTRGLN